MNQEDDPSEQAAARAFVDDVLARSRAHHEAHAALPMIEFPRAHRLPTVPDGWFDTAYAITFDGKLAILRASIDILMAWNAHLKRKQDRWTLLLPTDARATLSLFDGEQETGGITIPLRYPFPFFYPMADGSWIVADNIARRGQPNAMLVSPTGQDWRDLMLGSGIEHLQADPLSGFWVGYRDDSIFSPVHEVEDGGIVRFDQNGQPIWRLNDVEEPCIGWCDHSYALNISTAGCWSYCYSPFLLAQCDEARGLRAIRPMISFADAVAVSGDRFLMAGMDHGPGPRKSHDRIVLLGPPRRSTSRRSSRLWWTATVHRGINPREHLWTARGDTLHCVRGRTWHRLSIDEADAMVPDGPWRVPDVSV